MPEYKAILVGDVHVADKGPRSRKDDYTEAIFTKLEEINEIAEKVQALHILQAGDFFHVKAPTRNSHSLVRRSIHILSKSKVPWIITPGNHDLPNGRMDQLPKQPLGVLYAAKAARMPIPDIIEKTPIGEVWIHGAPFTYHMDRDDTARQVYYPDAASQQDSAFSITISHGTIIHGMDNFYVDYTNPRQFDITKCADVMFNGHIHWGFPDEVIYDSYRQRTVTFVNPGSISRGSLHEYNAAEQRVKVKILTVKSRQDYSIEDYYLESARPAEEVLAFDLKEEQAQKDEKIELYVDSILEMLSDTAQVSSYQDLILSVKEMNLEATVSRLTLEVLEKAYESTL